MKIHKHLTEQLVQAIHEVFTRPSAHADKIIERFLKSHPKWGSRDRKFFAENTYEIVRHFRKLWNLAGLVDFKNGSPDPDSISVKDIWTVWGTHWLLTGNELPDWPELSFVPTKSEVTRANFSSLAIEHSLPDWLFEYGQTAFGSEWPSLLEALNKPADVYLRANRLKNNRAQLIQSLQQEDIQAEAVHAPKDLAEFANSLEDCVKLKERKNIFRTKAFQAGLFEVQDAASQFVAPFLKVQAGQRVVDACAGGGGKTLHLASLMSNKGKILSMDIHEWKLKELHNRCKRNSIDIVETRVIESTKTVKRLDQSFDRVLLDVPCSGLGVIRRNPDAKWKIKIDEIQRLQQLQSEILQVYSKMTKIGGVLVYATCSVFPSENHLQVQKFLQANSNFELEIEIHLRPDKHGFDGFYAARILRKS